MGLIEEDLASNDMAKLAHHLGLVQEAYPALDEKGKEGVRDAISRYVEVMRRRATDSK